MELCAKCPIRDERYTPSDQEDKRTISALKVQIASMTDFIEYLFDHSDHLDHITYKEAWEEFEKWKQTK